MFIYVPGNVSATVTGGCWKPVRCERCGCEYAYYMRRSGSGQETVWIGSASQGQRQAAANGAHISMQRQLETGVDPAPCPDCGWFQAPMVEALRRRLHPGAVRWESVLAFVAAGVLLLASFFVYKDGEMSRRRASYVHRAPPAPGLASRTAPSETETTVTVAAMVATGLGLCVFAAFMIHWRGRRRAAFNPNDPAAPPWKSPAPFGTILRRPELERHLAEEHARRVAAQQYQQQYGGYYGAPSY